MRKKVQQRLAMALELAEDPATVFCVQPFTFVEGDGGEHLSQLLTRVMRDPDRGLMIATEKAFVFAFGKVLEPSKGKPMGKNPNDAAQRRIGGNGS